jgi:hypothetical protein
VLSWVNKKNGSPAKLRPATRLPGLLLAAGWQVPCGCQLARGLCWKGAARGVVSRAFWRSTSPPTNSHFLRFGNGFSWACKSKNPAKSWVFASIRNAKGSLKEFLNRRSQVRIPPGTLQGRRCSVEPLRLFFEAAGGGTTPISSSCSPGVPGWAPRSCFGRAISC